MQHRHNDDALPKGGDKRKIWILIAAALALVTLFAVVALVMSPGNGRTFPVYISEVLASNTRYPNGDGRCCDYVELYNSADDAMYVMKCLRRAVERVEDYFLMPGADYVPIMRQKEKGGESNG
jgi:hypothetical protein